MSSQVDHQGKVLPPERSGTRRGSQGMGAATNLRVHRAPGPCSVQGLVFSNPARSVVSHLVIFVGPFQLEILYDSV